MKRSLSSLWFIFVIAVSYWTVSPLFLPGFFPMHDDTQVARVYEMGKALLDGMFPVRWVVDLGYGYGYPIFSFYGPLAYYIGAIPMLFGTNALIATKIMFGIGIVASGVGMYYLARIFWGNSAAIISSLLYLYAPYHAVTIFVRGAVGEFFGYAVLPFVFYGLIKVYKEGNFRYFVVLSLSTAALIISHNLTALMVTPFLLLSLLILAVLSIKTGKIKVFFYILLGLFVGLGVSAFYWIPASLEMHFTNVVSQVGGGADFRDHFVCLSQLWSSQWGFAGSAKGCTDGLSLQVGKIHLLFVALSIPLFTLLLRSQKKNALLIGVSLFFLFLSIFLLLPSSLFIWEKIPQFWFIQYPWRFLMFTSFFSSFIAGGVMWYLLSREIISKHKAIYICILGSVGIGILLFYTKLFVPQTILYKTSNDYTNLNELRYKTSKISDEYLPPDFIKPKNEDEFPLKTFYALSDDAVLLGENIKSQAYLLDYRSYLPSTIQANIAHFPSWQAYLDGSQISFATMGNGYSLTVPTGRHNLVFSYKNTPIERAANVVSAIGILVILAGIIVSERRGLL